MTKEEDRGRTRERTRGATRGRAAATPTLPANPLHTSAPTQLPPIGSHQNILEQPLPTNGTRESGVVMSVERQVSSDADGDKRAPEHKKPKLEPKDNSVSTSVIPKPSPEPTQHQVFPESVQHQVFDLTAADTQDDDELTGADIPGAPVGAFPNLVRSCHPSGSGNTISTEEVQPAWIQELTKSLQGLHVKSDQTHNYCLELGASLQQHGTRLDHLEACQKETTEQQESTITRLQALEKVVADLEKEARSPRFAPTTPVGRHGGGGGISPRSPRSPRGGSDFGGGGGYRDPMQDLGLVIGGWTDARSSEAEEEVRNMFRAAGLDDRLCQVSGPSGRTNFMRASLNFSPESTIAHKRQSQKEILDKLKHLKCASGIEGQEGVTLWIQKDRSLEERLRIRALVLTKNFYTKLPPLANRPPTPLPEIVWRGQVFVGQTRLLRSMDEGHEPTATDQIIEDSKGNHTVWFVSSQAFEEVTGRSKETLQQAWLDYGPAATPLGAGAL